MSGPDKPNAHDNGARASAFDDVRKLLTSRIRELETEGIRRSDGPLTIGDGIELLGSLERIDELRDLRERITRLRDAFAESGETGVPR
ncbi:MAG TPA: hypothetical protein VF881_07825 [Polyangiaceae bacterium]